MESEIMRVLNIYGANKISDGIYESNPSETLVGFESTEAHPITANLAWDLKDIFANNIDKFALSDGYYLIGKTPYITFNYILVIDFSIAKKCDDGYMGRPLRDSDWSIACKTKVNKVSKKGVFLKAHGAITLTDCFIYDSRCQKFYDDTPTCREHQCFASNVRIGLSENNELHPAYYDLWQAIQNKIYEVIVPSANRDIEMGLVPKDTD